MLPDHEARYRAEPVRSSNRPGRGIWLPDLPYGRIALVLLVLAGGVIVGAIAGWVVGGYEVREIARQVRLERPDDPLDGLWIIRIGHMLGGAVVGFVASVIASVIHYVRTTR